MFNEKRNDLIVNTVQEKVHVTCVVAMQSANKVGSRRLVNHDELELLNEKFKSKVLDGTNNSPDEWNIPIHRVFT